MLKEANMRTKRKEPETGTKTDTLKDRTKQNERDKAKFFMHKHVCFFYIQPLPKQGTIPLSRSNHTHTHFLSYDTPACMWNKWTFDIKHNTRKTGMGETDMYTERNNKWITNKKVTQTQNFCQQMLYPKDRDRERERKREREREACRKTWKTSACTQTWRKDTQPDKNQWKRWKKWE